MRGHRHRSLRERTPRFAGDPLQCHRLHAGGAASPRDDVGAAGPRIRSSPRADRCNGAECRRARTRSRLDERGARDPAGQQLQRADAVERACFDPVSRSVTHLPVGKYAGDRVRHGCRERHCQAGAPEDRGRPRRGASHDERAAQRACRARLAWRRDRSGDEQGSRGRAQRRPLDHCGFRRVGAGHQ